jgi:anti-sigma factor RsiW
MNRAADIDWDRLSAYVDGELSAAEAARLAVALANDPALARQVATLALLKAASAEALDAGTEGLPNLPLRRESPATSRRLPTLAASLAIVVAGAMIPAAIFFAMGERANELGIWQNRAEEHYQAWLAADGRDVLAQRDGVLRLDVAGVAGQIPDLSVARLRVVHAVVATAQAPGGLFVGYIGTRGCRLGLWIAPAPAGLHEELLIASAGETATWRVKDTGYRIVARDMDAARFRAVAEYLVQVTRRPPEREPVRMATPPDIMSASCLG